MSNSKYFQLRLDVHKYLDLSKYAKNTPLDKPSTFKFNKMFIQDGNNSHAWYMYGTVHARTIHIFYFKMVYCVLLKTRCTFTTISIF